MDVDADVDVKGDVDVDVDVNMDGHVGPAGGGVSQHIVLHERQASGKRICNFLFN